MQKAQAEVLETWWSHLRSEPNHSYVKPGKTLESNVGTGKPPESVTILAQVVCARGGCIFVTDAGVLACYIHPASI
eukprot:5695963-Amphidinium_carterae.1